MIEITGNEISELSDSDLRALVGLLCEAELRKKGLQTAGVTWGGHQNAPDGGIDVRVELQSFSSEDEDGFIPRRSTGFQVKKPDMPSSAIISEMKPKNVLRQVIKELVDEEGAYIIVSSQGTTADARLTERRDAMRSALAGYPNESNLKVDFYDRERLAGWVRSHPSLVFWVHNKIGRPVQGWKAYGNWSNSPKGIDEEYILDEHMRIFNSARFSSEGSLAVDGINEIRSVLNVQRSSVRLVGLSGVGKTRFVQALFDERIGERPLNRFQVFYTDVSDTPNPAPCNFAERIIAQKIPAILVVDNCAPDLHKQLTAMCTSFGSTISLITVEYDVRDDYPEETEVFRLEPSSKSVIEQLVVSRFPHISEVDVWTIAEFAGGNARIALALANTIHKGESLGNLRDHDLFTRLFQQRNGENRDLLRTAEVCSLVYSFDIRTAEGVNDELRLLGSLIDLSVREIYSNVSEMEYRDLVQKRGTWRAVLPHAIANRLATNALKNIPLEDILHVFEQQGSQRFLRSFSKRLSFLHKSHEAIEISKKWLREDGLLGRVNQLDNLGMFLLENIAPVNPELVLAAIERVTKESDAEIFFSRENQYYIQITRLLRLIAYDKTLFVRAVGLLSRFALTEKPDENNNSIRFKLKSLFYLSLSGTHATLDQRLSVISNLIESGDKDNIGLANLLLSSILEVGGSHSYHEFGFGARSRDYGYIPATVEDQKEWYASAIKYTVALATSDFPFSTDFRRLLAEKFRSLWSVIGMYDELGEVAKTLGAAGTWRDGWLAIKETLRFDGKDMAPRVLSQLNELAAAVEPRGLAEKAKLYALSSFRNILDLIDLDYVGNHEKQRISYTRIEQVNQTLGREVGANGEVLEEILPELLCNHGNDVRGLTSFGKGLAVGVADQENLWNSLSRYLSNLEVGERDFRIIGGILKGIWEVDTELAENCLDMALTDAILSQVYPWLQTNIDINSRGVERLKLSLERDLTSVWQYRSLAHGGIAGNISDDDLCELLRLLASKTNGVNVAIEILGMKLAGNEEGTVSDIVAITGQQLILQYEFSRENARATQIEYMLSEIVKTCFEGHRAVENAKVLGDKIFEAIETCKVYSRDYAEVLRALADMHPLVFINSFLGEGDISQRTRLVSSESMGLLSRIDDDIIISWCEENPGVRYPAVASAITSYSQSRDDEYLEWTTLALEILDRAHDPIKILERFSSSFTPNHWSGSLAGILQKHLSLISDLKRHEKQLIAEWAKVEEARFTQQIQSLREEELQAEQSRNERFE